MDSDFKHKRGLHFSHINIRSIWKNYEELKIFLEESGLTCACITETWLNEDLSSIMIKCPGYQLVRLDRQAKNNCQQTKQGGGIGTYISNDLKYSDTELEHLNASNGDVEIQWLTLHPTNIKKIIMANIYRPPKGNLKKLFGKT